MTDYCNYVSYEDKVIGEEFIGVYSSIDKVREFIRDILDTNRYTRIDIDEEDFKIEDSLFYEHEERLNNGDIHIAERTYLDTYYNDDDSTYTEHFYVKECEII